MPNSTNLADTAISESDTKRLLAAIQEKQWWQGSLIASSSLAFHHLGFDKSVEWWIVSSQACNLYNHSFEKVPVFEAVAARKIDGLNPAFTKGDNPRLLHVQANCGSNTLLLEVDIQKRCWLPRQLLAELEAPTFHLKDAPRNNGNALKDQWLDCFSGWLARSYTRVALPDAFNEALKKSDINAAFNKMLKKHKDDLYGVYFSIEADTEHDWIGRLGEMPPPYLLGIMLVVYENVDGEEIKNILIKSIFNEQIANPSDKSAKTSRANLARANNIRILAESVDARSVSEITLAELNNLVRYSLVDHLSDSSMASS